MNNEEAEPSRVKAAPVDTNLHDGLDEAEITRVAADLQIGKAVRDRTRRPAAGIPRTLTEFLR